MGVREVFFQSFFFRQLAREMDRKKITRVNPLHYLINLISMCVFPFIAAPLLKHLASMEPTQFQLLVDERKTLIPLWMKLIMQSK